MRQPIHKYVWVAAGFWSFMVLIFNVIWTVNVLRNLYALSFAPTQGVVTLSEAVRYRSSSSSSRDGGTGAPSFGLKIEYDYEVGGLKYKGNRWRFGESKSSDSWASRTAYEHPEGSAVTVYQSRIRPQTAVLQRGLAGEDLYLLLFLAPFNVLMVAGWLGARWLSEVMNRGETPPDPRRRLEQWQRTVQGGIVSPRNVAMGVFFLASFIALIIVSAALGSHPPLWGMLIVWCAVIGATWWAVRAVKKRIERGPGLSLDEQRGTLTLRCVPGHDGPLTIGRDQVEAVDVEPAEGGSVAVILRYCDGEREMPPVTVAQIPDEPGARQLARALEQWLGIDSGENAELAGPA